ncbi:uncharacterized protein COLE_05638 [Cutaneotrichosporon oleaginosum]|uniref:uncharacterized protein n=1 Tax=Cutaneotrichosporon oleaginosum TaxID=879819 RepID=UPI001325E974|nr:hypothetical protein COLE_05638 [Cutaneotrichosporon oleaginosum]
MADALLRLKPQPIRWAGKGTKASEPKTSMVSPQPRAGKGKGGGKANLRDDPKSIVVTMVRALCVARSGEEAEAGTGKSYRRPLVLTLALPVNSSYLRLVPDLSARKALKRVINLVKAFRESQETLGPACDAFNRLMPGGDVPRSRSGKLYFFESHVESDTVADAEVIMAFLLKTSVFQKAFRDYDDHHRDDHHGDDHHGDDRHGDDRHGDDRHATVCHLHSQIEVAYVNWANELARAYIDIGMTSYPALQGVGDLRTKPKTTLLGDIVEVKRGSVDLGALDHAELDVILVKKHPRDRSKISYTASHKASYDDTYEFEDTDTDTYDDDPGVWAIADDTCISLPSDLVPLANMILEPPAYGWATGCPGGKLTHGRAIIATNIETEQRGGQRGSSIHFSPAIDLFQLSPSWLGRSEDLGGLDGILFPSKDDNAEVSGSELHLVTIIAARLLEHLKRRTPAPWPSAQSPVPLTPQQVRNDTQGLRPRPARPPPAPRTAPRPAQQARNLRPPPLGAAQQARGLRPPPPATAQQARGLRPPPSSATQQARGPRPPPTPGQPAPRPHAARDLQVLRPRPQPPSAADTPAVIVHSAAPEPALVVHPGGPATPGPRPATPSPPSTPPAQITSDWTTVVKRRSARNLRKVSPSPSPAPKAPSRPRDR